MPGGVGGVAPRGGPLSRSSASSLLCRSQTSLDRSSAASAPHLPATDHPATTAPMSHPEISRFPRKERPYMPGSKTTPGLAGARNDAPASVAFRGVNNVGTRVYNAFAAQWLAYTLPYRRFAVILAEDCARIGGDVGCYSFIAVDSHHILLAGLPAHSLALRPAHSRDHQFVTAIRRLQPFRYLHDCSDCFRRERIAGWALHPLI